MTRTQLADAMLKGLHTPNVVEDQIAYIHISMGICRACPLGAALIGQHDGDYLHARAIFTAFQRRNRGQDECVIFARLLDIPIPLAVEIENKHLNDMSIRQIAAWLKTSETEIKANV